MIIAIPLTENNEFSQHFGASAKAVLFEVDQASRSIRHERLVEPSDPEPCGWVDWLKEQGVSRLLAGGMGRGAQQRMAAAGILVTVGVPADEPRSLIQAWLDGSLLAGTNSCEEGRAGEHGHHHPHGPEQPQHEHRCGCEGH